MTQAKAQASSSDQILAAAKAAQSDDVYQLMHSSKTGLTAKEAQSRLTKYGKNAIAKVKGESMFTRFIKNFTGLMAILLWIAGAIAFFAKLSVLGWAIWAVNIINGLFSFWQEFQASKATDALQNMMPSYSRVIRDGKEQKVLSADLVPGDLVVLDEGDDVPADLRLLQASSIQVDQSSLTGEVTPIHKVSHQVEASENINHSDLRNMVFCGTSIMKGTGRGIVIKTGMNTDFGKIASLTEQVQEDQNPLDKEINTLVKQLALLAVSIGVAFFLIATLAIHSPLVQSFVFALGMIVAFIPEGLEPTVTLSLAGSVQRMAHQHALIKKLSSVETLGSASVICSDKTGTLTQNEMTVQELWTPERDYRVTGEGYSTRGVIKAGPHDIAASDNESLRELLLGGSFTDEAKIVAPTKDHPRYQILGDPTDACQEVAARKGKIDPVAELKATPRIKEFPFDSDRKMITSIHQKTGDHRFNAYTHGAPNNVVAKCSSYLQAGQIKPLTPAMQKEIKAANDDYAKDGLRVVAVAAQVLPEEELQDPASLTPAKVEHDLTFIGLEAMMDPPRPAVYAAARECRQAHIKVIMVTGDYGLTARSIALKVGIVSPDKPITIISGNDLKDMSDDELRQKLQGQIIFSRMAPEQKYRVVDTLQKMGKVVAVTGDGVNDAPALKKADIGVAMGQTGTDVAKEAADMILTDDNFASIVAAIREGRGVYENIRKFLIYILNSNLPEAVPSVLYLVSGGRIPLALTVMEILFIDLGTDMIPALGLGKEPPEAGIMYNPPRPLSEHLINRNLLLKAFGWYGLGSSIISAIAFFASNAFAGHAFPNLAASGQVYHQATTLCLAAIIACQIANVLNIRYRVNTIFNRHFFNNSMIFIGIIVEIILLLCISYVPILQSVFGTAPLFTRDWLFWICIPWPLILIDEIRKYFLRRHLRAKAATA